MFQYANPSGVFLVPLELPRLPISGWLRAEGRIVHSLPWDGGLRVQRRGKSGKMRLCGCCFAQCHMPVVGTQTYVLANKKIMATLGRTLRITMDHPRHPETCLFVGCSTLAASVKSHETLWNVCSSASFIAVSTE